MLQRTIAGALALVLLPTAAWAADELASARKLWLRGNYAEAIDLYRPLAASSPEAALGLARCYESQGKSDEAVGVLTAAGGKRHEIQAELARLALARGDLKEAQARAEAALRLAPEQVLARLVLAEIAGSGGRLDEAQRGYRRLIDYYNQHEIKTAETLHWIGLAAAEYARWNRLSDQFDFLVNDLYPDALQIEPGYWPAHLEAGRLFLEKHNQAEATKEFKAALALNPRAAEVHAAMAALAMETHDADEAEASLRRALEINPLLLEAWHLRADLAWLNFQPEDALRLLLEKALPRNPIDERTLGRVAACYLLLDAVNSPPLPRADAARSGEAPASGYPGVRVPSAALSRFARLVGEVTDRNPHAGEFFSTLADMLQARNKQSEAEAYYREAIRVMPRQAGPQAELGLLFMRAGREGEARKLLDDAFHADPFHVRVKNTLEVLDVLDAMEKTATEHFVLRYDKADRLWARYAGRHLEGVWTDLCGEFGYRPPGPTLIEVFREARGLPGQQWFGARMVGLPYLETVAASTGHIIAMTSPNEEGLAHGFNWARVLRHEMVHIITLQQTRFNIPHWFTEGLAVRSEGGPRPHRWNQILRRRSNRGDLLNLETINLGFARSMSGDDCQLAYCQGELYVEYMASRGGPGAVRKMLAAYAETPSTAEAIRLAMGISQKEFEQGYSAFVKKLVDGLTPGLGEPPEAEFGDLLAAHRARPEDPDAAARLACGYLQRGAGKEATDLAEKVLRAKPKHPLAAYVLARLRIEANHADEAMKLLEACLDRQRPDALALDLLADLKLKARRYDEAADLWALGQRLDPENPRWTASLARAQLAAGNTAALRKTLERLARTDADDLAPRKKLAELALARRDADSAAAWAAECLQINVHDAEAHRLLADAQTGRRRYDEAIEEYETAIELNPSHLQQRLALADVCVQADQPAKARRVLEELLKRDPKYPGAGVLLESLMKSQQ
ncbi:MAG: tetratricopeptide repeat protein [Thermoguttaceae bacterium]|jgi:tetratricopeptide (TPR) repeat protein